MPEHPSTAVEQLFEILITGNRADARELISRINQSGATPEQLVSDLFWPTYQTIERLYRSDQLTAFNHHAAVRLLRVLVDQNAARIKPECDQGRTIFAMCGPSDADDLGAQMASDMLEAAGFTVTFVGGGIANDEVLAHVNEDKPDVLLMFCSAPGDLPHIRELIDTLHEIGACAKTQIAVGGGVFNRAEGLAEEIGADLWAASPMEMVRLIISEPERRAGQQQRTVGRNRRKRAAA